MNSIKTAWAALCLSATAASAIPVSWEINFADPLATAIGSFVYDADTDSYCDISVAITNSFLGTSGTTTVLRKQQINGADTIYENNSVGAPRSVMRLSVQPVVIRLDHHPRNRDQIIHRANTHRKKIAATLRAVSSATTQPIIQLEITMA